jgi:ABC-2 type transport system ATP-binding protein
MDEADRCSRVALIYEGRIVQCDSPPVIRKQMGAEVLKIITDDWQKARELILALPGVRDVQSYGEAIHVLVDSASSRSANIREVLIDNKLEILEMREISPRMEEAFISFIRKMDQEN